jgi:hypothetical protein
VKIETFTRGLAVVLAARQRDTEGVEMLCALPCDEPRALADVVRMFSPGRPCADLPDSTIQRAILDWAS